MTITLTANTRVDITIQPWTISALDGSSLSEVVTGTWFTEMSPMYSHPHAVNIMIGAALQGISSCTMAFAIYEASRWADAIAVGNCGGSGTAYFTSIRWRYVTLLAAIRLLTNADIGLSSVIQKTLGDLSIRYGDRFLQKELVGRLFKELATLEPIIMANGCEGIGSGARPTATVRGADDPYRPFPARLWMQLGSGDNATPTSPQSPGYISVSPGRHQLGTPGSTFGRW